LKPILNSSSKADGKTFIMIVRDTKAEQYLLPEQYLLE
jgi:hypothetical protein